MNLVKKIFSPSLMLISIILLAAFLRTWQLNSVPTGISDDELTYIINAKSFFLTGKDTAGNWMPFFMSAKTEAFPMAEIPHILIAPFVGFFDFSLLVSKLPYVFASILQVLLLFLIVNKLIGKKEGLIVALVASLNPWSIFFGRTGYDTLLALFFYLLGFYILLITKRWYILLAFIPLALAFFSYIGTKLIFIPYILIICFYCWYFISKKNFLKQYLVLLILCFTLFFSFVITMQMQSTSKRLSEISTPNAPAIIKTVNDERKLSIHTPLTYALSNKIFVWGKDSLSKYLKVFSTEFLFLTGEGRSTFSLWYHGYFYYLDAIFLLIGLLVLFNKNKPVGGLLLSLIIIAPIPTVASTVGTGFAALRSALLYPVFIILIGLGISYSIQAINNALYKKLFIIIVALLYCLLILNFINIYFFRNPIYNAEAFGLSSRVLSKYIYFANQHNKHMVVISNDPLNKFNHYLFEGNEYKKERASEIQKMFEQKKFYINNVEFTSCQDKLIFYPENTYIIDTIIDCGQVNKAEFKNSLFITNLSDGGKIFKIFNDSFCNKYSLNKNPIPHSYALSDFDFNNLSEKQFCEKFVFN